jgi:hypothetical protein
MRKLAPLLVALPLVCAAQPQSPERYQEVLKEREEVLVLLRGVSRIKEADFGNVIQFSDASRGVFYAVTKENHPAHPAMVTRQLAEENGKPIVKLVNYLSGGDRAAFQRWLADIAAGDKAVLEGSPASAGTQPTLQARNAIEYKSPQEAYAALSKKVGPEGRRDRDGWIAFDEKVADNTVLWVFVPQTHPAYPATVKRTVIENDGKLYIDMRILCGAQKSVCDDLVRDFTALNEQMRREIEAKRGR